MSINKVYICGLVSSAKGMLRSLLDGHRKIINYPFDIGTSLLKDEFPIYCNKQKSNYVEKYYNLPIINSTTCFSIMLNDKEYYLSLGRLFVYLFSVDKKYSDIFDVSLSSTINGPGIEGEVSHKDYQFDVFGFFQGFIDDILRIKRFDSVERLQDTLYKSMINNCVDMKENLSDSSIFVQSSYNGYNIIEKILEKNSDPKILAVVRDPISLSYSNYKRGLNESQVRRNLNSVVSRIQIKYPKSLYSESFIKKVKHYNKSVLELSQIEKNVYVVRTEDIICNTRETMDGIADFLGIEQNKILYNPTLVGDTLNGKMLSLVGSIQDDPYKSLSKSQIDLLKYYYYGHNGNLFFKRLFINLLRLRMNVLLTLINNQFSRAFISFLIRSVNSIYSHLFNNNQLKNKKS